MSRRVFKTIVNSHTHRAWVYTFLQGTYTHVRIYLRGGTAAVLCAAGPLCDNIHNPLRLVTRTDNHIVFFDFTHATRTIDSNNNITHYMGRGGAFR